MAVLAPLLMFVSDASAQRRFERDRAAISNGWQFDYKAAREKARREKKPLMVVFRCVP